MTKFPLTKDKTTHKVNWGVTIKAELSSAVSLYIQLSLLYITLGYFHVNLIIILQVI